MAQTVKPTKSAKPYVDKFEKLKQKLAKVTSGSKGYFNPKEGSNVIRILPPVGDMEFFFQEVGKHVLSDDKWCYCPEVMSEGVEKCPICDLQNQLYSSGDRELAKKLRVQKKNWMNIIDREHEDVGPLIFTAGITILTSLAGIMNDPDYGDITDINNGYDITIERKGKNLETKYEVRAKPRATPLSKDQDSVDKWLQDAKDLLPVGLTDDPEEDAEITAGRTLWYSTWDRIAVDYQLDSYESGSVEEEEEEEFEEEFIEPDPEPEPVRNPVKRIQRKHTR